ncbi:hypothetical protein H5410_003130 [Solanum commersonii]|uniref:Uncharacterized protein n=1 Tax=Solanum commersonii TaxID=4109 RepID=A0A9J6B3U0_SOLCO|nr:hypothetical protein H5410_003130 [Solanum commersonii]
MGIIHLHGYQSFDISFNLDEGNNNNKQSTPPNECVMSLNKEANRNGQDTDKNGSFTPTRIRANRI